MKKKMKISDLSGLRTSRVVFLTLSVSAESRFSPRRPQRAATGGSEGRRLRLPGERAFLTGSSASRVRYWSKTCFPMLYPAGRDLKICGRRSRRDVSGAEMALAACPNPQVPTDFSCPNGSRASGEAPATAGRRGR